MPSSGSAAATITPDLAKALNLPVDEGVLVAEAVPDGPADKAGIEGGNTEATIEGSSVPPGGDIITKLDGKKVAGMEELIARSTERSPATRSKSDAPARAASEKTVTVTLGNRPASIRIAGPNPLLT